MPKLLPILNYFRPAPSPQTVWQRILAGAKTLAWVVPLTFLIWVYAEQEQGDTRQVSVPFTLRIDAPNRIVRLIEPHSPQVTAGLSGARVNLDNISRELVSADHQPAVQITVDSKMPDGINEIDVAPAISNASVFVDHGLSVKECEPHRLTVQVDDMVERTVELAPPPKLTVRFEPERVTVRAPKSAWAKQLKITPMIGADPGMTPIPTGQGEHPLTGIPLRADPDDDVTITPAAVDAVVTVNQANESYTLKAPVAVAVLLPYSIDNKYKVSYSPTLANVTVSGPPDKIAMVKSNEKIVHAYLPVSDTDTPGGDIARQVWFRFFVDPQPGEQPVDIPGLKVDSPGQYVEHFTLVEQ